MEKGHFGQYTGNARHSRTPVTKRNYRASVADDAAHIHYLKEDINYDAKHGHSDKDMTADEKHISKLAGDMKYDKKHHSPFKQVDDRSGMKLPKQKYEGGEFDPKVKVEGEVVVTAPKKTGGSGNVVTKGGVKYRKIGGNLFPIIQNK